MATSISGTTGVDKIQDGSVKVGDIDPTAIVGTVSKSGGIPTGAIIERGSNVNGEYVKFADGRLECSYVENTKRTTTIAKGLLYIAYSGAKTFAHEFVAPPTVFAGGDESSYTVGAENPYRLTTTGFSYILLWGNVPTSRYNSFFYTAIGRWY